MNYLKNPIFQKIKRLLYILAVPLFICSCTEKDIPEETSSITTGSVTENTEFALIRGWTGAELMNSIFYCGEYHPLPFDPEANEGFSVSDGIMIFPDNSFAEAVTDQNGLVIALNFERGFAPQDFSIYGIDFSSRPDDISEKIGIADEIEGNKDETITYRFYGGGIGIITFVYTEKMLVSVHIAAEI